MAKQNAILTCNKSETSSGNEIVTVADVKAYNYISGSDLDTIFASLIPAARYWIEEYLNKSITPKNLVCTLFNDGTFSQLMPYGFIGTISKVERRFYPLDTWVDISALTTEWEIQENKQFYAYQPAYYRITYVTNPDLTGLDQIKTAMKQLVVFFNENRGDQQLYQIGNSREAVRVVPDIIKNTLQGLKENVSWFG